MPVTAFEQHRQKSSRPKPRRYYEKELLIHDNKTVDETSVKGLFYYFPSFFFFSVYIIEQMINVWIILFMKIEFYFLREKHVYWPLYFCLSVMPYCRIPPLPPRQSWCYIYRVRFWKESQITCIWHLTRLCKMLAG